MKKDFQYLYQRQILNYYQEIYTNNTEYLIYFSFLVMHHKHCLS